MSRKIIAFYLPQYYPTPYNDEWWGKGFTEWTNTGKAKPLFRGHYQPKIPTDLGYYDLRVEETRIKQAALAKEYGIDGFCYWHYWFAGQRLLNEVFDEVVENGKPDFPFCLCWANHSWYKKTWTQGNDDTLLIEQTYPGEEDYINHFYAMLPAFKDSRYMKTDKGQLIFGLFKPLDIPDIVRFKDIWNELAIENGLVGFSFFGYTSDPNKSNAILKAGVDFTVEDYTRFGQKWNFYSQIIPRIRKYIFKKPKLNNYNTYISKIKSDYEYSVQKKLCIIPNFDHSPRSGLRNIVYSNSSPQLWGKLLSYLFKELKYDDILFIKSWNEWGEGNYLEPDIKFGKGFLEELSKILVCKK